MQLFNVKEEVQCCFQGVHMGYKGGMVTSNTSYLFIALE